MNTASTIDEMVSAFLAQLTEQGTALAEQLKALDEKHKADRAVLVSQIASVDRALSAMKTKGQPQAGLNFGKRTMSEQGRANIKAAMAARRERLAAVGSVAPAEAEAEAPAATEEQSEASETASAKKSSRKGGK